ncbi:MAG: iron-containing alcohol dehydrogenase [Treponema sp.]|jgi:alcohol dehydrogenase|nr:iron-containing alcohol dehydrogenase [Treponema sp.]
MDTFKLDPEILIGADTLSMAGAVCSRYGQRIMIAADHAIETQTVNRLKEILKDSGIEAIVFDGIEENSTVEMAENIVELSQAAHCNAIIGFGGRKTQIIARMAAIMTPMRITVFELLDGRILKNKFLPFIAVPTEGMDVFSLTEYFVASDPRNRLIKSIRSPVDLYAAIIIDGSLFKFLSGNIAAAFVFDGFLSAIEAYCSTKSNFLSDALLERSLNIYAKLIKSSASGINADSYAQASFLTSLGSSVSSPGAGAALAYAVNARFPVPKSVCSAALLPFIAEKLVSARPEKAARAAAFLGSTGKAASVADAANSSVDTIRRCMETLKVQPSLKEYNIPLDRVTAAAEAARNLEFTANSPWTVSQEEVFEIIKKVI